jgi:nitroreductase
MLSDKDLDTIFRGARSYNRWQEKDVTDITLQAIYDLTRWGPTAVNCSPQRILFVRTPEARARLVPLVSEGNRVKVETAPVPAILAYDTLFYDKLPQLYPPRPAVRERFANDPERAKETAIRNASMQIGYFIVAARALGLDCGPMGGFDKAAVDAEFFPSGQWKANLLCALGYGTEEALNPRNPRLEFDDACGIV